MDIVSHGRGMFLMIAAAVLAGCGSPEPLGTAAERVMAGEPGCPGGEGPAGDRWIHVTSGGRERSALLHVPRSLPRKKGRVPLVLDFHHVNGTPEAEAALTGLSALADERGLLVAYPAGIGGSWNAGLCCGQAWEEGVDDVDFTRDLIDAISEEHRVDPRRIFVTGMSNGALMAHRLGCELADRIAAIAPVAGVLHVPPATCEPARPISVLHVHGTADIVIPYNGGTGVVPVPVPGSLEFVSVAESLAIWRERDGCAGVSHVTYAHGDTTCTAWSRCAEEAEVEHCAVEGGGHTWPGGGDLPPVFGPKSETFDASERLLDFFEEHPM
ncbi:extracellular catalytic domain type 1 short-chain-length polyhydroxyalkanoate depolymerase [Sorangium sp. So ce341]|uniref:extracellular catalytic domain type 1 short-chain-length polyhydroxyalkanoate depolymerase n=1 Tax=Sorangium sp. So ce341 TaxID=3133302 RepID=UPI003F62825A